MFHKEMTRKQKSGVLQKKKGSNTKEKGILQELLATRSAAQAIQNNKIANVLRKEHMSL